MLPAVNLMEWNFCLGYYNLNSCKIGMENLTFLLNNCQLKKNNLFQDEWQSAYTRTCLFQLSDLLGFKR
jgi:hypothetical protein